MLLQVSSLRHLYFFKFQLLTPMLALNVLNSLMFFLFTYLNPEIAFCIIVSSILLSNTKESAATVGPHTKANRSLSQLPVGTWRNWPSLEAPRRNNTFHIQFSFTSPTCSAGITISSFLQKSKVLPMIQAFIFNLNYNVKHDKVSYTCIQKPY